MIVGSLVAVLGTAVAISHSWEGDLPALRPVREPDEIRSMSVDFGIVTDPDTDWAEINEHLESVAATTVELNAGRVEFTAFDWDEHPDAAAEPGTDHLGVAARAVHEASDGTDRQVGLIVDAFIPQWIAEDPSVAGVSATGGRSAHQPSATQLTTGEVGDRLVAYVAALGERYDPSQITITELFLVKCFGDDDLALYREMTGAADWPREADGAIDEDAPELDAWRAEVLVGLLTRMRSALDDVRDGEGAQIDLAMDVRVDWADPAVGVPGSGQDYGALLEVVDRLVLWAYVGEDRAAGDVEVLTAGLADAGFDMSRFTVSVGLWTGTGEGDASQPISSETLEETVRDASTHGVSAVNVTPLSYMTDQLWDALRSAWDPDGS